MTFQHQPNQQLSIQEDFKKCIKRSLPSYRIAVCQFMPQIKLVTCKSLEKQVDRYRDKPDVNKLIVNMILFSCRTLKDRNTGILWFYSVMHLLGNINIIPEQSVYKPSRMIVPPFDWGFPWCNLFWLLTTTMFTNLL